MRLALAVVSRESFGAMLGADVGVRELLHATALMFVAYTGYGRIATLGEEVRSPRRTIPLAIIATLVLSMVVHFAVTAVAVGVAGAAGLAEATRSATAALEVVAQLLGVQGLSWLVGLAAIGAMAGVSLNLLLGLSRVVLAMGRRGELPRGLARVEERTASPARAVLLVGLLMAGLVSTGSVKATWSFSALTVLVYYAITNLAALRLPVDRRRFPRWVAALALTCTVGLAFWVEKPVWLAGTGVIAVGMMWHLFRRSPNT